MQRWQKLTQILGVSELWQVPGEQRVVRSGHCWSQTLAMCPHSVPHSVPSQQRTPPLTNCHPPFIMVMLEDPKMS